MKQKVACFFIFYFLISTVGYSQISKGFWVFGGSGSLSSGGATTNNLIFKSTSVNIKPRGGYFFIDKLATGLSFNYFFQKSSSGGPSTTTNGIGLGPFVRYYFLPTDKRVNVLAEVYGTYSTQIKSKVGVFEYGLTGGVAIFLNSSVALEILPGFQSFREKNSRSNYFITQIGLQVHLEKDKE